MLTVASPPYGWGGAVWHGVRRITMRGIIRKLRYIVRAALGKELPAKPDLICKKERFGSDYGGWDVVIEGLNSRSVVYSFGVGEDASFEMGLIQKYGLLVHAFDPTPRSIDWVNRQHFPDNFVMHDYGIAAFDGEAFFNPPENPDHVSHTILDRPATKSNAISVPVKRLGSIMREIGDRHIDVLKMDVEGAEYEVIRDIQRSDIRPGQILLEFHHRFPGVGIERTLESIEVIRSMGYGMFSVSASREEYCFLLNRS